MITLRKIVYDIRGIIRDARSDDIHFTDRQIAFWVKTLRAKLLKERLDKNQTLSQDNYTTINNVSLSPVNSITGLDVDNGCKILRTGTKLPSILNHKDNYLIHNLRSLNLYCNIPLKPKSQAIKIKNNKYTSKMTVGFIEDDYLYILGSGTLSSINIEAIFLDPDEINNLINGEDLDMDEKYPIDPSLLDVIKQLILTIDLSAYFQLPQDRTNDAQTAY